MKTRKFLGGFLATVLAVASVSTGVLAANPPQTENITGSGTLIKADDIYDVLLPTNLSYAIDIDGTVAAGSTNVINQSGTAIYSASFGVINHSSHALKIDVEARAASTSKVQVLSADEIAENNALTSAALVATAPAISLSIAPVASGTSVTNNYVVTKDGASADVTVAAVSFASSDVAASKAVALSASDSTISFALTQAAYTVSTNGVSLETTNGGFYVSGDAASVNKEYDSSKTAYVDDPSVGFTIIGDANKFADWSDVESSDLPEITAVFTLTPLTAIEYDAIDFDDATDGMVVGTVEAAFEWNQTYSVFSFGPDASDLDVPFPANATITDVKCNGAEVEYTLQDDWITISFAQLKEAGQDAPSDSVWTFTFTVNGVNYVAVYTE